jgi:hypothetical protein
LAHLRDEVLGVYLADNIKATRMTADGHYKRRNITTRTRLVNSQAKLMEVRQKGLRTL